MLPSDSKDTQAHRPGDCPLANGKNAGRPRACDVEARMQNLVATAADLFVSKGYSKVSLEMIARAAHVAVRTIYVKFGGKTGLFNAVLAGRRERFFSGMDAMEDDTRPLQQVLLDFGLRFLELITNPASLRLQRMVISEAETSPELARTFYDSGPAMTREMLARFFASPDVRAQLRDDVELDLLPVHFLNCVTGDGFGRFLFPSEHIQNDEQNQRDLERRLQLFFRSVLR